MAQYRVNAPMLAISDESGDKRVTVTIPVGAVLHDSTKPTTTLLGLVGVYWEGAALFGVLQRLAQKTQCVRSA